MMLIKSSIVRRWRLIIIIITDLYSENLQMELDEETCWNMKSFDLVRGCTGSEQMGKENQMETDQ